MCIYLKLFINVTILYSINVFIIIFTITEIKMTFMNCFMDNHINMKESSTFRSYGELCQMYVMYFII